ncbi:MAG: hypothetical protein QW597_06235 [Thermoplasmataceae archaeon]
MIYLTCPKCGYAIDILSEEELNNPVKAKRLKYLTTRDQVCPNCVNTIGRCERIDAKEEDTPLMRVTIQGQEKAKFAEFCRDHGYAVATEYALNQFKEVK